MKRPLALLTALGLGAPALAEIRDESFAIGPEQVWIEFIDPIEILWVGPNAYERTQVLSGGDIEIVGFATDQDDADILGARAFVAVSTGTHSCDNLMDPLAYYVISLTPALATEGPFTTCGEVAMSVTNGAIVLEEDPMRMSTEDGGQFIFWVPGQGFTDRMQ